MVHWIFSLFYSDGMHLVLDSSLELGKSILKVIDSITDSRISNSYKNAVCSTDFKLNQEDFPTLSCIIRVRNCHIHKTRFSKSIFKFVSTSSVHPNKPISDSNVPPSKTVCISAIHMNLLVLVFFIHINELLVVMFIQVNQLVLVTCPSKPIYITNSLVRVNPFVLLFCASKLTGTCHAFEVNLLVS